MSGYGREVAPIHPILASAAARWLNVTEMEILLKVEGPLPISTKPPDGPPPSGTLFLYDRSVTRNYKDDGYEWVKKRNSQKIREDHVKLRVGGRFRIAGCYVHCANVPSMHRRAYHLLDPDTGMALVPSAAAGGNSRNRGVPSLVLVHYLDTEKANLDMIHADRNVSSKMSQITVSTSAVIDSAKNLKQQKGKSIRYKKTEAFIGDHTPLDVSYAHEIPNFDHETLNILWDMVMEEGGGEVSNMGRNMSDWIPTGLDMLSCMENHPLTAELDSEESLAAAAASAVTAFEIELRAAAEERGKLDSILASELAAAVDEAVEDHLQTSVSSEDLVEYEESKSELHDYRWEHGLGEEPYYLQDEPLPTIVDFAPEQALISDDGATDRGSKVLVCFSDPMVTPPNDSYPSKYCWHELVAFVSVGHDHSIVAMPKVLSVYLSCASILNPYTCRCNTPSIKVPGKYQLILLAVRLHVDTDPLCETVTANIITSLGDKWQDIFNNNTCNRNSKPVKRTRGSVDSSSFPIRFLSQLSGSDFLFLRGSESKDNESFQHLLSRGHHDIPAPPAAMAMVATVLSDFPNPPAAAVVPGDALLKPHTRGEEGSIAIKELARDPHSTALLSAALETTVNPERNRKRTATIEIPEGSLQEGHDVAAAASAWANLPSTNSDETTKVQEVDRHCKVRFVERLTSVIAETEKEVEASFFEADLRNIDDNGLDTLLDGLLVRIVESLGHVSTSSHEVAEELNGPDKSGFTLLHYAALYNLQSLIPVLLSHGANPDKTSLRGNLTPLHLACGAGNVAVVDMLIRGGCARAALDSFGSTPADHAVRNGFSDLAEKMNNMGDVDIKQDLPPVVKSSDEEATKRLLLQSAFSNLSLKDKLIINMMVKKRQRKIQVSDGDSIMYDEDSSSQSMENTYEIREEDISRVSPLNESVTDCQQDSAPNTTVSESTLKPKGCRKHTENTGIDVASVISETDQECFGIAMKLMNEEELQHLDRESDVEEDVRLWMLRRNYESIKEASVNLQETLKKHNEKKVAKHGESSCNKAQRAAYQSLKHIKSQAIADLVIRKNISARLTSK